MKNSKILFLAFSGLLTLFILFSCNKEDSPEVSEGVSTVQRGISLISIFEDRVRFSKAFSMAIQNEDFYNFVLQECVRSGLNDPEILYAQYYNKPFNNTGISFGNFLASMEINTGFNALSSMTF